MNKTGTLYYTSRHIEALLGINRKVLHYWRKIGLLTSGIRTEGGHYRYQFTDLVLIKTIIRIRKEGIGIHKIKKVAAELKKRYPELKEPLAEKSYYIVGKEVIATDKKGSFNPLTGQCTYIRNGEIKQFVKNMTLEKFNIPKSFRTVSSSMPKSTAF